MLNKFAKEHRIAYSSAYALPPLGERVDRGRRFDQPARAGPTPAEGGTGEPKIMSASALRRVRGWFREKTPHPPSSVGHLLPKGEGCDRARGCGGPRSS